MLESETKKMEEKLELVKKMMELEKDKRTAMVQNNNGTMWRGANTSKGVTKGYADKIVQDHKKK